MFDWRRKQKTKWLWMVSVLLFLGAATLMPVAQGLCFGRPHTDCPLPSALELFSPDHGSPSSVRQGGCCPSAPYVTARSRGCHCERGEQAAPEYVPVTLSTPGNRDFPALEPERYRYRIRGRGAQDLFSLPLKFFSQSVPIALTMLQVIVLLI